MTTIDPAALAVALAANPELAAQLQAAISGQPVPAPGAGLPSIDTWTAGQLTYFDNGDRKNVIRHKMTIEIWTNPKEQINVRRYQHKQTAALREHWQFRDSIKGLATRGSITQEHHDAMIEHLEPFKGVEDMTIMCGLVGTKKGGTRYFDRQWVIAGFTKKTWLLDQALVIINDEPAKFSAFEGTDCKGNRLKPPAQCQSRIDLCSFSTRWSTE